MDEQTAVLEFKCPCCNAPLIFSGAADNLRCEYCDNTFDLETVQAYADSKTPRSDPEVQWEEAKGVEWSSGEQEALRCFTCESCGGELLTDDHTAATFCPYCGNPSILPSRLSGGVRPDGLIPFRTSKEDAKAALLKLCKGKKLLPKFYIEEQQLEKITGIYVPFWLYDCSARFSAGYEATRIQTWSDSRYIYTKTDHYLLNRQAEADFSGIPMDGSSKMEDAFMESIEPYDYSELTDFQMSYLSGFLADKYDVESRDGEDRIRQRVDQSMDDRVAETLLGYQMTIPHSRDMNIRHSKARYVLLPVWMLNTKYRGKTYTFAMNGQTGKMTGSLPVCPRQAAGWFAGIWAFVSLILYIILMAL